jgi:hypothetical protein
MIERLLQLKWLEKQMSNNVQQLIRGVLISCGGFLSPVMANSLIEEWKQAKKEKQWKSTSFMVMLMVFFRWT